MFGTLVMTDPWLDWIRKKWICKDMLFSRTADILKAQASTPAALSEEDTRRLREVSEILGSAAEWLYFRNSPMLTTATISDSLLQAVSVETLFARIPSLGSITAEMFDRNLRGPLAGITALLGAKQPDPTELTAAMVLCDTIGSYLVGVRAAMIADDDD